MTEDPTRRAITALVVGGPLAAGASARLDPLPDLGRPLTVLLNPLGRVARLENERVSGAMPDFFRELARRAGLRLQIELLPRARLMARMQQGLGDLSVGTRQRVMDPKGEFVPVVRIRVMLVFDRRLAAAAPPDTPSLLERSDWRGLIVRGAALSEAMQGLVDRLESRKRLWLVRDWATVLRMLLAARAEFTLFSPTLLYGESSWMGSEVRDRLQVQPLSDLAAHEVGVHIASHLPPELRARLAVEARALAREGHLRKLLLRDHPAELLAQDLQFLDTPEHRP